MIIRCDAGCGYAWEVPGHGVPGTCALCRTGKTAMGSKDPQVRREAWQSAREQAAEILENDMTYEEMSNAAWGLAEAFRDLDPGEREQDNPVLGPRGLDNVVISHHLEDSGSFDIAVDHKIVAMVPAATLAALVHVVTEQDDGAARKWMQTLKICILDLRRILYSKRN